MSSLAHAVADASIIRKIGIERSPLWEETRKAYLARNPKCVVCETSAAVEVHHMFPFHYVVSLERPDLELDDRNFMTLCEDSVHDHHLLIGHLEDWQSYDPPADPDQLHAFVTRFAGQAAATIKADATFQQAQKHKPPHLDNMTAAEKTALKQLLDTRLPPNAAIMKKAVAARKKMK